VVEVEVQLLACRMIAQSLEEAETAMAEGLLEVQILGAVEAELT
jgi:hypothetical protein